MERKIREIIRQVGDIGEKVSGLPEIPTAIEIDIILDDIRKLYDGLKELRSSSGMAEMGPSTEHSQAESTTQPASEPAKPAKPEPATESGAENQPEGRAEPTPEDRTEPASQSEPADAETRDKKGKTPGPSILADKYKSEQKFINESLARGKQDVSSKIHSKPIQNIGSALGVNDRFQLIKDLFNGDKESFQKTINSLDEASNFNDAFNYINSSFDWDMEEDSVQLLLELVRRKFIVNQNE